ncbi:ATP-binding cassette domain-containing protein [Xylophilus rhododendri]|uniref:ATP-binding cassette domain-containing protein n=2 Tax=Xylophilus rhododendri TaxID=2697032 RepID=A0A857JFA8_9BURK|nr:ABC transporter ATP-binding protein [Xylophilus rhododendri]QHJ01623.1 ATP-binding cassette domain-containing protein [Xylophilus rhododendri]
MNPPSTRPLLARLQGVHKTFAGSGAAALRGIDLDIHEGDFVCLLGPSGCGKSTVLRLLAGLLKPGGGSLQWGGEGKRPEIGFVFQDATLMPWASVADNVYLPWQLQDVPRAQVAGAIDEALALVGLREAADAYPRQLSGGMRMRVSIARALVTRPRLLLMDEPFAALDEITRNRLNQDLAALWRQLGCTVVFVTHSVIESVQLASRVVVMAARPGRIVGELEGLADRRQPRLPGLTPEAAEQSQRVSALLDRAMGMAA